MTPRSSPRPPAPCPTRCGPSTARTRTRPHVDTHRVRAWTRLARTSQTEGRIRDPCVPRPRPALEKVLGPWLEHDSVLEVIAAWPTPADLRKAGRARVDAKLKSKGAKRHATWAQAITDALDKQTVVVAGTDAAGVVLPHPAHQLAALHAQRHDIATQIEALAGGPPSFCPVPTYMPGIGVPAAAVFLAETLGRAFNTGAHLASHIRAHPSDQTLRLIHTRGVHLPRRQQEIQTRHVLLRLRLAALRPRLKGLLRPQDHPGQSALGQAVIALAHRRILTLHAMTRDATPYDPQPAPKLATAALHTT